MTIMKSSSTISFRNEVIFVETGVSEPIFDAHIMWIPSSFLSIYPERVTNLVSGMLSE